MRVKLLNKFDLVSEAWSVSRPHLSEEDKPSKDEILKMGLPASSFIHYVLEIEGTIRLRDLLFTIRPIIPWAISNRTYLFNSNNTKLDESELDIFVDSEDIEGEHEKLNQIFSRIESGEKQDYVKRDLPLSTLTKFLVSIDFRTLVNFLYTVECVNDRYFHYISPYFFEAMELSTSKYKELPKVNLFSRISVDTKEFDLVGKTDKIGTIIPTFSKVTCNLMAQFIRQHSLSVKNSLWNELAYDTPYFWKGTCNNEVVVGAYIPEDQFQSLCSTRSCWFAQWDKEDNSSWSSIIGPYLDSLDPKEFMNQLPCHGSNKCVILGDMEPRIIRKENNLPCPLLLEYPNLVDIRKKQYLSDSKISSCWSKIKKYIPFNPLNSYTNKYFSIEKDVIYNG